MGGIACPDSSSSCACSHAGALRSGRQVEVVTMGAAAEWQAVGRSSVVTTLEARMHRALLARFTLSASVALIVGCESSRPLEPSAQPDLARGTTPTSGFATLANLPALDKGVHGEASAVQQSGGIIAGYSWHRDGRMIPVTWKLTNGAWTITALSYPATATSA